MAENKPMNEQMIREKIKLARESLEHQLHEHNLSLASLAMTLIKSSVAMDTKVGGKQSALTAMYEEIGLRLALIEFIDMLDLDGRNKSMSVKSILEERHLSIVMNLENSAARVSGRAADIIMACTGAWSRGLVVPLGANVRKNAAGEHARMMKDLAILGFIQQFGVTSRSKRGLS